MVRRCYALPNQVKSMLLSLLFVGGLSGCDNTADLGPQAIKLDRDICRQCAMLISDPNYAVQVYGSQPGTKAKHYKFDDIGCAVIWLDRQTWKNDPRTLIWVKDYRDGHWLDARRAWYLPDKISPMGYSLAAQGLQTDATMNFQQAQANIRSQQRSKSLHKHTRALPADIQVNP